METDIWTLLTALLPPSFELNPKSDEEAELTNGDKTINIIYNDVGNSYTIDGTTLHFEDTDPEIVNTLLVPYLLQLFDGVKRI